MSCILIVAVYTFVKIQTMQICYLRKVDYKNECGEWGNSFIVGKIYSGVL